jgi:2-isopropylmalate synthase
MSQDLDLNGSPKSNGSLSIPRPNGVPKSGPDAVSVLEAKANGM